MSNQSYKKESVVPKLIMTALAILITIGVLFLAIRDVSSAPVNFLNISSHLSK